MTEMSQHEKRLFEDISEIKTSLKELTAVVVTQALQCQRLDTIEERMDKVEITLDHNIRKMEDIHLTTVLREPTYLKCLKYFDENGFSHDSWLNQLLGGALRNGLWIVLSAAIAGGVSLYFRKLP